MAQLKVFQCPNCKEFIATDAKTCRFCSTPIDASVAQAAAAAQAQENKQYRRKGYAKHMLSGGGLFGLGIVITVSTFAAAATSQSGGHYVITYGLMLSGVGNFLYGLVGYLGELRK